jgi:hypothetical protein
MPMRFPLMQLAAPPSEQKRTLHRHRKIAVGSAHSRVARHARRNNPRTSDRSRSLSSWAARPANMGNVRIRRKRHAGAERGSGPDPNVWTRRALQEKTMSLERTVLHQCIRPRVGAPAPDHHGNPRAPDLISGHASKGYLGSSVLGCAGKTISPSLLFLSQTSVGKTIVALTLRFSSS